MYTMNVYDDDVYEISNVVIKRNKSETEFLIRDIYFYWFITNKYKYIVKKIVFEKMCYVKNILNVSRLKNYV